MNTLYTVDVWYTHRFNKTSICTILYFQGLFMRMKIISLIFIRYSYVSLIRNCVTV